MLRLGRFGKGWGWGGKEVVVVGRGREEREKKRRGLRLRGHMRYFKDGGCDQVREDFSKPASLRCWSCERFIFLFLFILFFLYSVIFGDPGVLLCRR